jgi:hypothetical protein
MEFFITVIVLSPWDSKMRKNMLKITLAALGVARRKDK